MAFASGTNYAIELEGSHAAVRVWRRPDLETSAGAESASELVATLQKLASRELSSMTFDIRAAPSVAGPRTEAALIDLLRMCEQRLMRIAVLIGEDPMQVLQFRRLVTTYAPTWGRVVSSLGEAEQWSTTRSGTAWKKGSTPSGT